MIAASSGDNLLLPLELFFSGTDFERVWPNPKLAVPTRTTRTAVKVVHLPTVLAVRLISFRFFGFISLSTSSRQPTPRELVRYSNCRSHSKPVFDGKLFILINLGDSGRVAA